jgi:hypothetical protein
MTSTDGSTPLSPDASRLFLVYKTMSGMLLKRGYMIPKDMRELTPKSFVAKFGENPSRDALTILVVRWSRWMPGSTTSSSRISSSCSCSSIKLFDSFSLTQFVSIHSSQNRKRQTTKPTSYFASSQKTKRSESSPSRSTPTA